MDNSAKAVYEDAIKRQASRIAELSLALAELLVAYRERVVDDHWSEHTAEEHARKVLEALPARFNRSK